MKTHLKYLILTLLVIGFGQARSREISLSGLYSPQELAALDNIKSLHAAGSIEAFGLSGTIEVFFEAPDKIRLETDLDVIKLIQIYDGEDAWLIDQNDRTVRLSGVEKRSLVSSAYLFGASYISANRMKGVTRFLGDTLINNNDYLAFLSLPNGGDSLWIYYNRDSGRVDIHREVLNDVEAYTFSSDFRKIGGFEIPFHSETVASVPEFNSTVQYSKIDFNVGIADSLFQPGGGASEVFLFPPGADSVVIPFDFYNHHIYLDVSINGNEKTNFMLDSGAGINIILKEYAEKIGLEFSGEFPAGGIAGYQEAGVTEIDSMKIGPLVIYRHKAAVIDFSRLGLGQPAKELGGVIGYDFLSRFPIKIDYGRQHMIVYDDAFFRPPESSVGVPFETYMKVPVVRAELDGVPGNFLVDLGSALGIIVHEDFMVSNNLLQGLEDVKEITGSIAGVGGKSSARAAIAGEFRVGALVLEKPPILISEGDSGVLTFRDINGSLGNLVLKDFVITLDYLQKTIYIAPSAE
jgi:outer membrane lipoprotein-sorting protein